MHPFRLALQMHASGMLTWPTSKPILKLFLRTKGTERYLNTRIRIISTFSSFLLSIKNPHCYVFGYFGGCDGDGNNDDRGVSRAQD